MRTLHAVPYADTDPVPLRLAAERLGITTHAVRQRIRRQTLHAVNRDGRWYVYLDRTPPADTSAPDTRTPTRTGTRTPPADSVLDTVVDGTPDDLRLLVTTLQAEVDRLWAKLDERDATIRDKDEIMASLALQERETPAPVMVMPAAPVTPTHTHRPAQPPGLITQWLRRLFG